MSTVERITALELLHRLAEKHGWALILAGSHDHPVRPANGNIDHRRQPDSELAALALVELSPQAPLGYEALSRKTRLQLGDAICRCTLDDHLPVLDAAETMLSALDRNGYDLKWAE